MSLGPSLCYYVNDIHHHVISDSVVRMLVGDCSLHVVTPSDCGSFQNASLLQEVRRGF